jgi:hypothetical protein
MKLEMIPCIKCRKDMPKLRLEKYGYRSCVDCSTTGAYRAITTTHGEGDHTWNDIQLMTPEEFSRYERSEGINPDQSSEINNFNDEDRNLQGPFTIIKGK